ncbi:MAG: hypothetical protein PWQ35_609 [Patescibacteria group bacterium]|nr:hypothetical protein [Patescibacteria group bacterium]
MIDLRKQKEGFSLIEVLISVAIFAVIILASTEIFRLVINGQREAIASQNVQESLKYFFEVTGKEIRMARRSTGTCNVPSGDIYAKGTSAGGDILYFKNYYNECVTYELISAGEVKRFQITRDSNTGFISPAKIEIDALRFQINSTGQPLVTMLLSAHSLGDSRFSSKMDMQTSITSRYYR